MDSFALGGPWNFPSATIFSASISTIRDAVPSTERRSLYAGGCIPRRLLGYLRQMTDEELQQYCGQRVRLQLAGRTLDGELVCGAEAQIAVSKPYAVKSITRNPAMSTSDTHLQGIAHAENVESIELLDERADEEIAEVAEDAQTPG
jgi:hypothetical protein